MGYGIKNIGVGAFNNCDGADVYITAQTPPKIQADTFGDYSGKLHLQGQTAINEYNKSNYWKNFKTELMIEPTSLKIEHNNSVSGNSNGVFNLKASMEPENVTLPNILWHSTNPRIATVNNNGVVTLNAAENNNNPCNIIDGPVVEVIVDNTGVRIPEITLSDTSLDLMVTHSATLTANGKTAICNVTVLPILVESLTIDPTEWSGIEGSEFTIKATVLPENAANKALLFESSDTTVATVDEKGNVKVLKEGSCVITVSTVDGSDLKAECVIASISGVEAIFTNPDAEVDVYDMNGVLLKKGCSREGIKLLKPAIYILRSGGTVVKAVVR